MARVLKIIEGEGSGTVYRENKEMLDNGDPEVGELYQFTGDPDYDEPDADVDGWQFDEIKEVHRKNGKIIFKDDASQAVIEDE